MCESTLSCIMMYLTFGSLDLVTGLILVGGFVAVISMIDDIIRRELEDLEEEKK